MKKNSIILTLIITLIVIIIFLINFLKVDIQLDEETINCITQNSKLYVLKTCGHCAEQKEILGEHLNKFNITDCSKNKELCTNEGIKRVPIWVINNQKYNGKKSLKELKELTNC